MPVRAGDGCGRCPDRPGRVSHRRAGADLRLPGPRGQQTRLDGRRRLLPTRLRREDVGRATVLGFLSVFAVFASVTIVSYVLMPMGALAGPRQSSMAAIPVPALVMTILLGQLVLAVPAFFDDTVNFVLDLTSQDTVDRHEYGVHFEVGRLRKVLVCAQGLAHRRLTPTNSDDLLFDDVMWVENAQRDHAEFVRSRWLWRFDLGSGSDHGEPSRSVKGVSSADRRTGIGSGDRHHEAMDDLPVLRREFSEDDDAFLAIVIRDQNWDKRAFSRLERAMRQVCETFEQRDQQDLPRWLVEGFWICVDWLPDHTAHPRFPRPEPSAYYEAAFERLRDLQYWLVTGVSPYLPSHVWADLWGCPHITTSLRASPQVTPRGSSSVRVRIRRAHTSAS